MPILAARFRRRKDVREEVDEGVPEPPKDLSGILVNEPAGVGVPCGGLELHAPPRSEVAVTKSLIIRPRRSAAVQWKKSVAGKLASTTRPSPSTISRGAATHNGTLELEFADLEPGRFGGMIIEFDNCFVLSGDP